MPNIKTKFVTLNIKAVGDDGSFEGYGSIFGNIDSYGDIVDQGAFTKTLAERGDKVKLLWQHNWDQPIGIFTSLAEDPNGLKLSGQLCLGVQAADEAYALLKQGALDGMSIGYQTIQNTYNTQTGINHLTEVKLYEVSLVTFPANEAATVTSVKSAFEELSQEQRLKTLDFINSFKSTPSSVEPPITEASVEKHSATETAVKESTEEPLADLSALEELEALHSLDIAAKTLERLLKNTRK